MKSIILGSEGLGDTSTIDEKQIKFCKDWISKWLTPRKTINTKRGSYNLKHMVEIDLKEKGKSIYISNGAFIKAAIELDYKYKKNKKMLISMYL